MYREERLLEVIKSLMTDNETKDNMIKAKNTKIKDLKERNELYRENCKEWKDKCIALEKEFNESLETPQYDLPERFLTANSETKLSINKVSAGLQDLAIKLSKKDVENIQKFLEN